MTPLSLTAGEPRYRLESSVPPLTGMLFICMYVLATGCQTAPTNAGKDPTVAIGITPTAPSGPDGPPAAPGDTPSGQDSRTASAPTPSESEYTPAYKRTMPRKHEDKSKDVEFSVDVMNPVDHAFGPDPNKINPDMNMGPE